MSKMMRLSFFFNDTATTEIYTLSLHDALPIFVHHHRQHADGHGRRAAAADPPGAQRLGIPARLRPPGAAAAALRADGDPQPEDRKSTRLNSSHANISYAVFCLIKKNKPYITTC